jgi:hypothetical protein
VSGSFQFPWDTGPAPLAPPTDTDAPVGKPKSRGRRPASVTRATAAGTAPGWLFHHLTISGPAETVERFAAAARGSGVTPWQVDYAALEDDIFVRAVSQPASRRNLTVEGCRILARQFRDKVEAHQACAAALVGRSVACAFDLHMLLPVPPAILLLGPDHPDALAWLAQHWGVTERLRQVCLRPQASAGRRLPRSHAVVGYGFFTRGETPQAAVDSIAAGWPGLRFVLAPRPAD